MKKSIIILLGILVLVLLSSGCNETSSLEFQDVDTPSSPMKINVSLSKAPALNGITEITATIWYTSKIKENMSETIAQIILPNGFEVVNGNATWKGYVKNEPKQFSILVKAIRIGNWTIEANIRSPPTGSEHVGGRDWTYVSVFENKGIISKEPFPLPKREDSDKATKINDSSISSENKIDEDITIPEPMEPILDTPSSPKKTTR